MSLATALKESIARLETIRRERAPELAAPVLAVTFAALVIVGMLRRLPLSVDFSDESFSTALAYRFALGDRPFIDEINSAQTAGMILAPFVWAYVKVTHSPAGIVMFTRYLFLVFRLAVGATVFATIRRHVSWPLALVAAMVGVVFVPHSIQNLGYNVLGSGFLAMSGFIAVRAAERPRGEGHHLFWAGLCGGLASFAYPPLVLPVALLGLVILLRAGSSALRDLGEYVGGGTLVLVCVAPFLVAAGTRNLQVMIELGATLAPRAPSKLFDLVLAFSTHSPVSMMLLPGLAVVLAALELRPAWSIWALPLFVAVLALYVPGGITSQLSIVIYAGLFAPVFLVLLWDEPFCRALFVFVWVPSVVAGIVTAFTSSNGELNGGIGLFPGALLFIVYEAMAVEKLAREAQPDGVVPPARSALLLLGPAILVLSLLARYTHSVYRDGAPQELEVRIESGPYRGLYTTPEHANLSAELEDVFRRHENLSGKVLVYWDAPGGYLFTRMRPAGNTVWMTQAADQGALLSYYRSRINGAGFSLKIKASGPNPMPIDHFLEANGRELESTPKYLIMAEPARH
jgi:hypothetical protein